ncbi:MAG: papain-like cysteine protease family protein [Planctomycetota bacterium]
MSDAPTDTANEVPSGFLSWAAKHLGYNDKPKKKKRVKKDPEVVGPAQRKRADDRYKSLSKEDKTAYDKLKKSAKSDKEKDYLDKALASQYSVKDIEKFAKKINGKDDKWIQDNLKLTGNSKGKGVKQQWKHSCNATTVQAIRGQLDPIYALKLHEENADITDADDADGDKKNKKLADEQKKWLESKTGGTGHAGTAVDRGAAGGAGRWAEDLMNNMSDVTGVEYSNKLVDGSTYKIADAIADIDKGLKAGHPVPIVIGKRQGDYQHYVLVTGFSEDKKGWEIHDPWSADTVIRSLDDIKANKINLAGAKMITALDNPKAK